MRQFLVVVLFGLVLSGVKAADSYPKSYPFDKEVGVTELFPALPDATPNFKFDESDPGGYTKLLDTCDLGALFSKHGKQQFSVALCPGLRYNLAKNNQGANIVTTGMTAEEAVAATKSSPVFNCSNNAFSHNVTSGEIYTYHQLIKKYFKTDVHEKLKYGFTKTGIDNKIAWCKSEEDCCKNLGSFSGVRSATRMDEYKQEAIDSQCTGATLQLTCQRLVFTNLYCQENYLSATKRSYMPICPDFRMKYYASCAKISSTWKTSKATADDRSDSEPPAYKDKLTQLQVYSTFAIARHADKMCQPYSYYYPSHAKGAASSSSPGAKAPAASSAAKAPAASSSASSTSTSAAATAASLSVLLVGAYVLL